MAKSLQTLLNDRVVILDGATGTELIARGLRPGECPDGWNLTHPDRVKEVHKSYYDAGSDIVLTNTFGASRLKLEPYGLQEKVSELNRAAAKLIKEICPPDCFAGGDMGPTGKFLKPTGPYEPRELEEVFEEQALALRDGGVDLIAIETMFDLQEARAALKGALKTGLPVFVTLTFNRKKKGFFTMMGDTPGTSFKCLRDEGATAVGANCTLDGSQMVEFVESLKDAAALTGLLIAKPNAGQPRVEGDKTVYDAEPGEFLGWIKQITARGAKLVGGCCGTSPLFIKKLVEEFKS